MAKVTYTLLDRPLNSITDNEKYSDADLSLIDNYEINKQYDFEKNYIESHFYSIYNTKLLSVYDYELPTEVITSNEDLSTNSVSQLSLKPQDIAVEYGFVQTDVSIVFHFLNDLYTIDNAKQSFYIQEISQDRKEVLLYSDKIETNQLINITEDLKDKFKNNQYFEELWLNCGDNDLFIVTNIDVYELEDKFTVALKLYEPLPKRYGIKSFVQVVEKVSDSIVVQVEPEVEPTIAVKPRLRPANFDVKLELPNANPTKYFNYDELFSYSNSNSNRELYSLLNEKSVAVNIDHSNYEEFIHFSSATERLKNFKYKLQLIESYQTSLNTINSLTETNTINVVGSDARYTNLIQGIVGNFDHYERHLYFESGSSSWPKTTSSKPHNNKVSTDTEAVNWYNSEIISASNFDAQNYDVLGNALPEYVRDDNANNPGVLFTHMIGQHFDNLWIYTKAITDKYNADNRTNVGISKDLVKEAIKSLGVKIHNSEEGSTDLFKYLIADSYDSGSQSEVIETFTSVPGVSIDEQPVSRKEYETEVYKRIYHNIPLLTKAKGTQRGLRALINCFGIPSEFLKIKQYGGKSIGEDRFFNYDKHTVDALEKVRIETRESGSVNTTLNEDVSIQKSENKLTQDIHRVEVGFSPTDSIDEYILTQVASDFSIDQYLGDPRNENKLEYSGLVEQERRTIGSLKRYQLNDFVRILKFYDNTLFKMIKDFLPARTTADTGIIIKPGLLSKSKTKAPEISGTQHDHEGTIDTAFIEGYDAGAFDNSLMNSTTVYSKSLDTVTGTTDKLIVDQSPKYNGELSGSKIEITDGELNKLNNFKILDSPLLKYNITTVESDAGTYTSFSLNSAGKTTPQVACALLPSDAITYYHDGVANLPQINDTIYLDSGGNTVLVGADRYYHGGSSQKAFQVANDGSVTAIEDCSQYDNIPGAPPAPEVAFRAKYAYSQNETAVPIIIRSAENGATANITASLGASTVQQEVTISNTNYQLANLNLASLPDTTSTEITLSVKLTDAAGNQSTESTEGSSAGDFGKTIPKDTTPITGHSALFVTTFQGSTAQTTNTNGNFYIKVSNLPTTEIVIANAVISSTGGGTSYISKPNLNNFNNGSGDASGWMYLFASNHSLNNGTVSIVVTLTDAASNVSSGVSDTVSFQLGTASMNPSTANFGGNASSGLITVTSNTSWNLVALHSWLTLSSSTGSGNASRNWYAQQNYSYSSRVGIINLQVGGSNVDMLTIQQGPYGNCVDPETDITLESGHTKKAKDIRTGDIVRTKHENTMEMLSCIVTKAELIKDTKKLRITYSDRELVCSPGHRIYVDNKSEFIAADLLEIGDTTTGYEVLEIEEIVPGEVVDITVEKAHTYISNGILSHNNK